MDNISVIKTFIALKDLVDYFYLLFFSPKCLSFFSILGDIGQTGTTFFEQKYKSLLVRIETIDKVI